MARALALTADTIRNHTSEWQLELLRRVVVLSSAAALILAGKALPF